MRRLILSQKSSKRYALIVVVFIHICRTTQTEESDDSDDDATEEEVELEKELDTLYAEDEKILAEALPRHRKGHT